MDLYWSARKVVKLMNTTRKQFVMAGFLIVAFLCGCESKLSKQIKVKDYFLFFAPVGMVEI